MSYFLFEDAIEGEENALVAATLEVTGEDVLFGLEAPLFVIASALTGEDLGGLSEVGDIVMTTVITGEDLPVETGDVVIVAILAGEDIFDQEEDRQVTIVGAVTVEDIQAYLDETEFIIMAIIRSLVLEPIAPRVRGRNPRPDETAVTINKKVGFYLVSGELAGDGVDISTVRVRINGTEYDFTDPEFSYSGSVNQYFIEVDHPDWEYEQAVDVEIDATSLCGEAMATASYSFTTEWESSETRKGYGLVEIFPASDYSFDVLTIEEDWVRQGLERYTPELEVWWGRYQKLPYIENLQVRIEAGATNALGKEVLDNGWLSIKVEDGSFVPMLGDTTVDLGPMFTNTKKSIFFKLLIPEGAATKRYMVLELVFEPQMFMPYGRFRYARGIYQNAGNMIDMSPNNHLYRAYVFDAEMWNELTQGGIVTSPFGRGEDMKW